MKKQALTLLEIMIVIFLITLVTGAIGYNMRGTLDKGRAFRTEQAKAQLEDLLNMCLADGANPELLVKKPEEFLKKQGLAKDPNKLVLDGWSERFDFTLSSDKKSISAKSKAFTKYNNKQKNHTIEQDDFEDED